VTTAVTLPTGLTLSLDDRGDRQGPAVVLLPGPTDSWRSYERVLEHLPVSIRAVAASQRGHGDSDKPAAGFGIEDFAADVIPLLDALGIERAVLAGHSGSCLVARRVAIDSPGRVAGLVLEASPVTLKGDERLERFITSVLAPLEDPIDPRFARQFVLDTSSPEVPPETVDLFTGELLKVPARVWRETFTALALYDDSADLGAITAPTLLVWGDADDLIDRAAQETLAARIRNSELLVYPGVGHTPRWEDPRRFAADVAAFVSR
jgi:pimeloyl-ACP methyl ester carboxylesterase